MVAQSSLHDQEFKVNGKKILAIDATSINHKVLPSVIARLHTSGICPLIYFLKLNKQLQIF